MIQKSTLAEIVYERITQMLFDGLYPPGAPITRKELAERMGVSPTPVGEAIARLMGEGIIEQGPRSGYMVKEFTYQNLESVYAIRAGVEGIALRLVIEKGDSEEMAELCSCFDAFAGTPAVDIDINAYMKADQKFHRRIVKFSGNPYVLNYNRSFEFQLRSYQKGLLRAPEETISEHKEIISSIQAADAVSAQQRMIEHHMATSRAIREQYLS